ncbi:FAR1 DNA-binding domain, partial [Sesbania bispinosa]
MVMHTFVDVTKSIFMKIGSDVDGTLHFNRWYRLHISGNGGYIRPLLEQVKLKYAHLVHLDDQGEQEDIEIEQDQGSSCSSCSPCRQGEQEEPPNNAMYALEDNNDDKQDIEIESGMRFESSEEVKRLYQEYAIRKGFSILTRNSRKGVDGKLTYFNFSLTCSREESYVSFVPTNAKSIPSTKMKCIAHITTNLHKDGLWHINKCVHDHSHELSPGKS